MSNTTIEIKGSFQVMDEVQLIALLATELKREKQIIVIRPKAQSSALLHGAIGIALGFIVPVSFFVMAMFFAGVIP